ncbi:hypothetical protein [Flavobacterium suaedae]|uniref:hypothetical protein n=1 Tax=Flavobacterium suaedae TaxID=1767027 RepID=UPI001E4441DB|nr:hypothetical protein [Flavobacterium suaedae]
MNVSPSIPNLNPSKSSYPPVPSGVAELIVIVVGELKFSPLNVIYPVVLDAVIQISPKSKLLSTGTK